MENFLNFCWVLLALAALLAWLCHAADVRRRRQPLQVAALVCVLALMFPVISATDDLHPVPQAMEDSSKRAQKAWIAIEGTAGRWQGIARTALPATGATIMLQASTFESLQATDGPRVQPGVRLFRPVRSPPAVLF
jgi:hypothetical protein